MLSCIFGGRIFSLRVICEFGFYRFFGLVLFVLFVFKRGEVGLGVVGRG